ncbi:HU family DNA-binding protein [Parasulfitobacter algicola]|uniref:HU family DNA-binding protein n=1 Tax=Parasulfitobacter algicola TaxID=2614809 RepID=A0ABX2ISK3_9RHOB|nr:HU family DNA-binding protein [Sulfitobacter algicola]NSX55889.1 HU family DNA-binding protein [Sulfitobacter algicola]
MKKTATPEEKEISTPEKIATVLRKRDFLNEVVEQSGIKKKDAKPVVETMLALLGDAIARGDELNLPPFGKLKINREKHLDNADIYICKLRRRRVIDGSAS